jgi:hypothetical protein
MPDLTPLYDLAAPYITGGVVAIVLSAAARALPEPVPMGSRFYLWFYNFAGYLLANFDRTAKQSKPEVK